MAAATNMQQHFERELQLEHLVACGGHAPDGELQYAIRLLPGMMNMGCRASLHRSSRSDRSLWPFLFRAAELLANSSNTRLINSLFLTSEAWKVMSVAET
jgi:hypothetical protein